jgi:hypothetical protein
MKLVRIFAQLEFVIAMSVTPEIAELHGLFLLVKFRRYLQSISCDFVGMELPELEGFTSQWPSIGQYITSEACEAMLPILQTGCQHLSAI